ncbi:MAG: hypothetical protein LCH93_24245, partial [Proteobacteria bacterium]|nr:hypothetical protein [Pseudomonadota bacterium]
MAAGMIYLVFRTIAGWVVPPHAMARWDAGVRIAVDLFGRLVVLAVAALICVVIYFMLRG